VIKEFIGTEKMEKSRSLSHQLLMPKSHGAVDEVASYYWPT